jgi:signal transduction histidine kinase
MTANRRWHQPNSIPFIVLALAVVAFMIAFFDRWDMNPWQFSLLTTSAGLTMLASELLVLRFLNPRSVSIERRTRWFLEYGLTSVIGSITLVSALAIVGLAQDRAPFVLGIVIIVRVLNTYVLAYMIDEILAYRSEAQRIREYLAPALRSVEETNALLGEIETAEASHEIDVITRLVQQPLDRLSHDLAHKDDISAATSVEAFVDGTLRPLSHRMHPTSVSMGITAAADALGIQLVLDDTASALEASHDLLDTTVLLELHRWLTNTADTNAADGRAPVIGAHVHQRVLRLVMTEGIPTPLDARHAVAGIHAVDSTCIEVPLAGQFVDPVFGNMDSTNNKNAQRPVQINRVRYPRKWSGDQGPTPYLVAALAVVAVPATTFIRNAQVTQAIALEAMVATVVPVILAIALSRVRVSGRGWWPPTWIVASWLGVGLVTGLAAAATLDAFSGGVPTGQWFAEITRSALRLSIPGIAVSFFGEFAAQARNLAHHVERQTQEALEAREQILDREHERSRLIAEVLHRRVQSRLAAIALLFRLDRRTEAVAELDLVTGTLLPTLITELGGDIPETSSKSSGMPIGFTITHVDSPELQLLLTDHPDTTRTIIDECATNALRHGSAMKMAVSVELQGDEFILRCVDDGVGPPAGQQHHGLGSLIFDQEVGAEAWSIARDADRTIAEFHLPCQHGHAALINATHSTGGDISR